MPTPHLGPVDAAQVHRHPGDGRNPLDGRPERLQPAYAHATAGRREHELVAEGDPAGAERAGDDRTRAGDRKGAVDPQPDWRCDVRRGHGGDEPV